MGVYYYPPYTVFIDSSLVINVHFDFNIISSSIMSCQEEINGQRSTSLPHTIQSSDYQCPLFDDTDPEVSVTEVQGEQQISCRRWHPSHQQEEEQIQRHLTL